MTVENMKMLNLVAPIEYLHNVAREIALLGNVHLVNALHEVDESNFTLPVEEENIQELADIVLIKPYEENADYSNIAAKMKDMLKLFDIKPVVKKEHLEDDYNFEEDIKRIEEIYRKTSPVGEAIDNVREEAGRVEELGNHFRCFQGLDVNLERLNELQFFSYKIGMLSKENRLRLKRNYANITAVVLNIGACQQGQIFLVISPKELETETVRILRSLNFYELEISQYLSGTYRQIMESIREKQKELCVKLKGLKEDLYKLEEAYGAYLQTAYSRLALEEELSRIKKEMAYSGNFLYLSGWIPKRDVEHIVKTFETFGNDVHIMFKETTEVNKYIIPPTKLKNNWLLKPFESLVKMYGIPSYNEADPTIFLSITYMLLFGAMFGDVGQGIVLLSTGFFARRNKEYGLFGDVLIRLGFSSAMFGLLYGSVFGFEHVIPALLIRPIININQMLLGSVGFGVLLLLISFGYSIGNAVKRRDLKEGLFGANGTAGLLIYLTLITLILNAFTGKSFIPNSICYFLLVVLMTLIVVREPLANSLLGQPAYEEDAVGYYIESGFGIFETLLAMLSGTISFVRVGAFALNHVGLFMAFETMAKMTGNTAGGIMVYIIGNAVIIGLEGLIVFIQGLRLEYYEMFSKYYRGEGVEFSPAGIRYE